MLLTIALHVALALPTALEVPRNPRREEAEQVESSAILGAQTCAICGYDEAEEMIFHKFSASPNEIDRKCEGADAAPGVCHLFLIQFACSHFHQTCADQNDAIEVARSIAAGILVDVTSVSDKVRSLLRFNVSRNAIQVLSCDNEITVSLPLNERSAAGAPSLKTIVAISERRNTQ